MRNLVVTFVALLCLTCCTTRQAKQVAYTNYGDSITTIDSVTYYWQNFGRDSAIIYKVYDDELIHRCVVYPSFNSIGVDEGGNWYILPRSGYEFYIDLVNMPDELTLVRRSENPERFVYYDNPGYDESDLMTDSAVVVSEDGKFKIVTWDLSQGGETPHLVNLCTWRDGSIVYRKACSPRWFANHNEQEGCEVIDITDLRDSNGKTLYLVSTLVREWATLAHLMVEVLEEDRKRLEAKDIFVVNGKLANCIQLEFDIPSWSRYAEKLKREPKLVWYDKEKQMLYVPRTVESNDSRNPIVSGFTAFRYQDGVFRE